MSEEKSLFLVPIPPFVWCCLLASVLSTAGVVDKSPSWTPATLRPLSLVTTSVGTIVINEIHAVPESGVPEFVELYNIGSSDVDLSTLTLEDSRHVPSSLSGDTILKLKPGEYVVLTKDAQGLADRFGQFSTVTVNPWPALNNTGDEIRIAIGGNAVDSVIYGSDWLTPTRSLERINPYAPGASRRNWATSVAPQGATPGHENSVFKIDLEAPTVLSTEYVSDTTIEVRFSEPIDPNSMEMENIILDEFRPSRLSFSSQYEVMILDAQDGAREIFIPAFSDYSGNASGPFQLAIAQRARSGDIEITEIMFDPLADGFSRDYPEFIELVNISDYAISLAGVRLKIGTSPSVEPGISLRRTGFVLNKDAFAVIYSEPNPDRIERPESASTLDESYSITNSDASFLPVPTNGRSLGLRNTKDRIEIYASPSRTITSVTYDKTWHDDRFATHKGRSLSRTSANASLPEFLAWSSTAHQSGATPGSLDFTSHPIPAEQPQFGDLRINEIMFDPLADERDGRPDQPEFLELINAGAHSLELNGMYLTSRNSERPEIDSLRLVYRPLNLLPGEITVAFSVPTFVADGDENALAYLRDAFPEFVPDHSSLLLPLRSSLRLDNDGETLFVVAPSGQILDSLSYSPDWHHFLISDGKGSSLERIDAAGPSGTAENWTTSVAAPGGTPGTKNSVAIPQIPTSPEKMMVVDPKTFSPNADGMHDIARITITTQDAQGAVFIRIFDLNGRVVRELENPALHAWQSTYYWDGRSDEGRPLPSGVYIVFAEIVLSENGDTIELKSPLAMIY